MFRVDRDKNRLLKLRNISFSEVGLREREHLQEWFAAMPETLGDVLGTELLIIQKEFDGFDGTRERLDLLALDKNGQLVVIENKLDDSGRDVVWQALKYAAYCSSLKRAEIISIFQKHLDRAGSDHDATTIICEFLEEESIDEILLNEGNDQRIVFVAANFRREVTATVLWLREHQIDARCVKIAPYQFENEIFVDLQQVIPTPEAADYMIRMAEKDTDQRATKGALQNRHGLRREFWSVALAALQDAGLDRYQAISPTTDNWLACSTGVSGCIFSLVFLRTGARVELVMQRPSERENKWIYDQLYAQRDHLETQFGPPLSWERHEQAKRSFVRVTKDFDGFEKESWPEMIDWMVDNMIRLQATFSQPLLKITNEMRASGRSLTE